MSDLNLRMIMTMHHDSCLWDEPACATCPGDSDLMVQPWPCLPYLLAAFAIEMLALVEAAERAGAVKALETREAQVLEVLKRHRDRGDGYCARCRADLYPCPDAIDLGVSPGCRYCGGFEHGNPEDVRACPTSPLYESTYANTIENGADL